MRCKNVTISSVKRHMQRLYRWVECARFSARDASTDRKNPEKQRLRCRGGEAKGITRSISTKTENEFSATDTQTPRSRLGKTQQPEASRLRFHGPGRFHFRVCGQYERAIRANITTIHPYKPKIPIRIAVRLTSHSFADVRAAHRFNNDR